jgi:hypothetical protein
MSKNKGFATSTQLKDMDTVREIWPCNERCQIAIAGRLPPAQMASDPQFMTPPRLLASYLFLLVRVKVVLGNVCLSRLQLHTVNLICCRVVCLTQPRIFPLMCRAHCYLVQEVRFHLTVMDTTR